MSSLWQRMGWDRFESTNADMRTPQLDGLRGLAILAVVLHHAQFHPPHFLDWGPFGVRLFFVLSAYLITQSLWRIGDSVAIKKTSYLRQLKEFHLRRFARVLPAYLAALFFGVMVGMEDVRSSLYWHLGFLSNVNFAMLGWFPASTGHFWSLAVQEQFYMIWPFVLLVVPFRWFPWVAVGLMGLGYAFRVWCFKAEIPNFWCWLMLPGWLDAFAMGGLLAWVKKKHGLPAPPLGAVSFLLGLTSVAGLWFLNRGIRFYPFASWVAAMPDVIESAVAVFLIWISVAGIQGPFGVVLNFQPLRFLGRISYGIFIYHLIVFHFLEAWLSHQGIDRDTRPLAVAACMLAVTIPLSVLSWHLLENPILRAVKTKWLAPCSAYPVKK